MEKTRGRVHLELEVAIFAPDNPRDDELTSGFGVGVGERVGFGGLGFGLGLWGCEGDVELWRRGRGGRK